MTDRKSRLYVPLSRRSLLKGGASLGALSLAGLAPIHFVRGAFAEEQAIGNFPKATSGAEIVLGFNVPQTGAYADEGADELRAYQLAVKHLNGEGDGGMLNTMAPKALKGNGILGKKVTFVTGDTQTKSDAARASAKRMIEKDGAIMVTGGSSSGVAVAVQSLCQEMGIIFMCGLTHSNDTTGKDRRRYGFRHFLQRLPVGRGARRAARRPSTASPAAPITSPPTTPGAGRRRSRSRTLPRSRAGRR
jgi:branched-chain amino acid transport system substrate-binding protein